MNLQENSVYRLTPKPLQVTCHREGMVQSLKPLDIFNFLDGGEEVLSMAWTLVLESRRAVDSWTASLSG